MAFSKRKQALLDELRELGSSDEEIHFLQKRNIAWIEVAIESNKTHKIITKLAERAAADRRN